jgi:hypothetical protein
LLLPDQHFAAVQPVPAAAAAAAAAAVMSKPQKLRGNTGFTSVEVFRKYLWFLLRERQFDTAAVEDMVLLKQALGLTDDQVGSMSGEVAAAGGGCWWEWGMLVVWWCFGGAGCGVKATGSCVGDGGVEAEGAPEQLLEMPSPAQR